LNNHSSLKYNKYLVPWAAENLKAMTVPILKLNSNTPTVYKWTTSSGRLPLLLRHSKISQILLVIRKMTFTMSPVSMKFVEQVRTIFLAFQALLDNITQLIEIKHGFLGLFIALSAQTQVSN